MKRIIIKLNLTFLAIILLSLGLDGCKNLDFPNPNGPDLDNPPDQQRLVAGSTSEMRNEYEIYLRVVETFARNVYYFEVADPRYTGELLRATSGQPEGDIDPGGFLVSRHWQSTYRVIKTCQTLIDAYSDDLGAVGYGNTIIGYQLLMLLNYTYDNGIKIEFSEDINTPFTSSLQESFAEIERRLDAGYTALTNASANFDFTLSGGFDGFNTPEDFAKFNRAIRARVSVLQSKWGDALTALANSFIDAGDMDIGVYHVYTTGAGDQGNSLWEDPESEGLKLYGHPSFQTDAEAGDSRYSSKIFERPDANSFDNLTTSLAVTIASGPFDRLAIIRNEELLLLRAEANIGNGALDAAETDINMVRAAAGLGDVDVSAMSADDALNQLLHEKRYSLYMEGHRWIDMRHYEKLDELPLDRTGDVVIRQMPRPESEESGG